MRQLLHLIVLGVLGCGGDKTSIEVSADAGPSDAAVSTEPSVLLDDFEDVFGDAADEAFVLSAKASVTGAARETGGKWYGHTDTASTLLGVDDIQLTSTGTAFGNLVWDGKGAVGAIGHSGRGLRIAANSVASWAGVMVELRGPYGQDWMDLSGVTQVSFQAKGTGAMWMQFHVQYQGAVVYVGTYVALNPDWSKQVIDVAELAPSAWDANSAATWESTHTAVGGLDFEFFTTDQAVELYLDDVRLHGIGYDAWGFPYTE